MEQKNTPNIVEGLHQVVSDAVVSTLKDNENLRNNGRMRAKYDKWLVLIPFLCYPAIFLISAEIAVYGGYQRKNCYLSVAFL